MRGSYLALLLGVDALLAMTLLAIGVWIAENGKWTTAALCGVGGAIVVAAAFVASARGVTMRRSGGTMVIATTGGIAAEELLHGTGQAVFLGAVGGALGAFVIALNALAVARSKREHPALPALDEDDVAAGVRAEAASPDVRVL